MKRFSHELDGLLRVLLDRRDHIRIGLEHGDDHMHGLCMASRIIVLEPYSIASLTSCRIMPMRIAAVATVASESTTVHGTARNNPPTRMRQ